MNTKPEALNRRDFIKTSGLAAISAAALATGCLCSGFCRCPRPSQCD